MDRRGFLSALASIPLVTLFEAGTASPNKAIPKVNEQFLFDENDWIKLGGKLAHNLDKFYTAEQFHQKNIFYSIAFRIMLYLSSSHDEVHTLAKQLNPGRYFDVRKAVQFTVMDAPTQVVVHPDTGAKRVITACARKVRSNRMSFETLQGTSGIDAENKFCADVAKETALEIVREIQNDWANGSRTRVYALYMPPHLFPTMLDPNDFSLCRRFMIRYAKFA